MHPPGQLDVSQPPVSPSPTLPPHSAPQVPPLARPGLLHRLTGSISKQDINRMKTAASHALDMLGPLLSLASEASSDAGIPGLSIALSAVSEILTKVQAMSSTIEGVETLETRLRELSEILVDVMTPPDGGQVSESLKRRIDRLTDRWTKTGENLGALKKRGRFKRFIRSEIDADKLASLVEEINSSLNDFLLEGAVRMEANIDNVTRAVVAVRNHAAEARERINEVHAGVGDVMAGVEGTHTEVQVVRTDVGALLVEVEEVSSAVGGVRMEVQEAHTGIQAEVQQVQQDMQDVRADVQDVRMDVQDVGRKLDDMTTHQDDGFLPPFAKHAPYDADDVRRSCLTGTRTGVLSRLQTWVTIACSQKDVLLSGGNVFLISGLAGTGKTTVAVSMAKWCRERNLLGANFFCSRFDAECSDPNFIFTTISRQLCRFNPQFKEKVVGIMKTDPDIAQSGIERQFEELILRPLEDLKDTFGTCVIVLDGLDECKDDNVISAVLSVIAKYNSRIKESVLFLITSRPEPRITALFEKTRGDSLKEVTTQLLLHTVEPESVLEDIRLCTLDGFSKITSLYDVEEDWPSPQHVDKLVELSHGVFIWIATALLFIMDLSFSDPEGQLQALIDNQPDSEASGTILDSLYLHIIEAASSRVSATLTGRLHSTLGTISLAQEPLSVTTLSELLGFPKSVTRNSLIGLRSVLSIPDDADAPIRVIHPTFPEFLTASFPPKPAAFSIEPVEHHLAIFVRTLEVMRQLKRNIAGIASSTLFKDEIHDLSETLKRCISSSLSYSCRYWSDHLRCCFGDDRAKEGLALLRDFIQFHLLHWLEVCGLLGALESSLDALEVARRACLALDGPSSDLMPLLADCQRFALTFSPCVARAPLQLYASALALAPGGSAMKLTYAKDRKDSLVVDHGAVKNWKPCVEVFTGHDGKEVSSVAFSPDGSSFATGGEDNKAKIWKTVTRTPLLSLEGHTKPVRSVAYSPDGTRVVTGSNDGTVRVWDVPSGRQVHLIEGYSASVSSVSYAAGGSRIFSASEEGEVKLLDASDGRCLIALQMNTGTSSRRIPKAAISTDATTIAYCTEDELCLHDVLSGSLKTLSLSRGKGVAFSPDGRYVAAHTSNSVHIWTFPDISPVRSFCLPAFDRSGIWSQNDTPRTLSTRLSFSKDGVQICGGCSDGSVRMWRVEPGDTVRSSARLDFFAAMCIETRLGDVPVDAGSSLAGHEQDVKDVAWNPDGLRIVSAGEDGTIRGWDVALQRVTGGDGEDDGEVAGRNFARHSVVRAPQSDSSGFARFLIILGENVDDVFHLLTPPQPLGVSTRESWQTLVRDIADPWDLVLRYRSDELWWVRDECMMAVDWAFLTGTRHAKFHEKFHSNPVAISRDGSIFAFRVRGVRCIQTAVIDFRTGAPIAVLSGHGIPCSIAISPDNTLVCIVDDDDKVGVWRISDEARLCHGHVGHNDYIRCAAFSFDARLLVTGSKDRTARVLDIAARRVLHVLRPHKAAVVRVAFTTDASHVVCLDSDDGVYVWSMESGALVFKSSRSENENWVHAINFSPDDTGILIRMDHDQTLQLPLWRPGERPWPVYRVSKDGWLYAMGPGKTVRLGWLLPDWRFLLFSEGATFAVLDSERQRAVKFDVSGISEYREIWG